MRHRFWSDSSERYTDICADCGRNRYDIARDGRWVCSVAYRQTCAAYFQLGVVTAVITLVIGVLIVG